MGFDPITATIIGLVGSGLSYAAQSSAAASQAEFATLNAGFAAQQATNEARIQSAQSNLQRAEAQAQQRFQLQEAQAIRQQTDMEGQVAQSNLRRERQEFQRQMSQRIAQQGGSGVSALTGSPMDFLIDAASQQQQAEQDSQWMADAQRRGGYRRAAGAQLGANTAGINADLYAIESLAAIQRGRAGVAQAQLGGLAGRAQARATQYGAFGNLASGLGTAAGQFYSWNRNRKG